jgi:hypothetical protein
MGHAKRMLAAAGGVLMIAGTSMAATPWTQPSGNGAFFTYENGQNAQPLNSGFGNPQLQNGVQFVFIPQNFQASASGGGQQVTSDQFDVDLHAFEGYKFTEIRIQVLGNYSITPTGSINVTGAMDINELPSGRSTHDNLVTTPVMPITSGSGSWQGDTYRDLSLLEGGVPFSHIHISYSNNLIAISTGGSATVYNTIVGFPIAVTVIPAPGALALLGVGGLVAARRRR